MRSRSPAARLVPDLRARRASHSLVAVAVGAFLAISVSGCAASAKVDAGSTAPAGVPGSSLERGEPVDTGEPVEPVEPVEPARGELVRRGEFVADCPFSHRSPDDPLVHPHHDGGQVATAHSHDFFGNTTTDEHSTPASLLASGSTTCDLVEDLSSYWAPTLFRDGEPVPAEQFAAYYDAAPGADRRAVVPLPSGLSMIAGNDPRPGAFAGAAGWVCGKTRDERAEVPSCRFRAPLTLRLTFPDCWDGRHLDSDDHRSHVAYGVAGACPPSHPVAIVRLVLSIQYPIYGDPSNLTLASGPLATAHADFMNAWTEAGMRDFTELCIHRQVTCGTA